MLTWKYLFFYVEHICLKFTAPWCKESRVNTTKTPKQWCEILSWEYLSSSGLVGKMSLLWRGAQLGNLGSYCLSSVYKVNCSDSTIVMAWLRTHGRVSIIDVEWVEFMAVKARVTLHVFVVTWTFAMSNYVAACFHFSRLPLVSFQICYLKTGLSIGPIQYLIKFKWHAVTCMTTKKREYSIRSK